MIKEISKNRYVSTYSFHFENEQYSHVTDESEMPIPVWCRVRIIDMNKSKYIHSVEQRFL